MVSSLQDCLASTCQHFVDSVCIFHSRILTESGAEYYLKDSNGKLTKVGQFVKKPALFDIGDVFEWENYIQFRTWMRFIVAVRPRFIQPYYRAANALVVPCNLRD